MEYKGYSARVEFDESANVFHGQVLNLRDVITFEGTSVEELWSAFKDSVDDYIEFCAQSGEEPEKPFSGKFLVRLDPAQHRSAAIAAGRCGLSLNSWITEAISKALAPQPSSGRLWEDSVTRVVCSVLRKEARISLSLPEERQQAQLIFAGGTRCAQNTSPTTAGPVSLPPSSGLGMSNQSANLLPELPVSISAPRLRRLLFERKQVDKATSSETAREIPITLGLSVARLGVDEVGVDLLVSLNELPTCSVEATCGARFRLTAPETSADLETALHDVAARTAPATLYPFVREVILSTIMRAGLQLPGLPVVDFSTAIDPAEISIPPLTQSPANAPE